MLQACVGCGRPTTQSRCEACSGGRLPGWEWERLKERILRRDRYVCAICGGIAVTVDHIRPISAGGSNDPANLRSLCRDDHLDRHR
jgi:5-methylcytosine-specific restriction endonuclease McrA